MPRSPFAVDGSEIERLDAAQFARLVNALLSAECAVQGLPMDSISITSRINDPDGGIDASFTGSVGSRFVAWGDSAWHFKLSTQNQKSTKKEVGKPGLVTLVFLVFPDISLHVVTLGAVKIDAR